LLKERSNEQWLEELRGPEREKALADLRAILLRGLKSSLRGRAGADVEDFAQEAMIRVRQPGLLPG
jgi:DNA-directed RNA polymerase specialized sigma24 family protein